MPAGAAWPPCRAADEARIQVEQQLLAVEEHQRLVDAGEALPEPEPEPETEPELESPQAVVSPAVGPRPLSVPIVGQQALDEISNISEDTELEEEQRDAEAEFAASDARLNAYTNIALGVCMADLDVEEWPQHSDKAWIITGNGIDRDMADIPGGAEAMLCAKGHRSGMLEESPFLHGAGTSIRVRVGPSFRRNKPNHIRAARDDC